MLISQEIGVIVECETIFRVKCVASLHVDFEISDSLYASLHPDFGRSHSTIDETVEI